MSFTSTHTSGAARTGVLETRSGRFETPFFMPVVTYGTPKFLTMRDFMEMRCRTVIANSFLLSLTPGVNVVEDLHAFMHFDGCIFTDCGAFQMLRSNIYRGHDDRGILLKDPDGEQQHHVTPESVMRVQETLKADVAMMLDNLPAHGKSREEVEESSRLTTKWAKECLAARKDRAQLVFGICQGGTFSDLREQSASEIGALPFDGFALGGLRIGEDRKETMDMVRISCSQLPIDKPRYLMGAGHPLDIVHAISEGVDIFDSAYPTISARHNGIFTSQGLLDIGKSKAADEGPLDPGCDCWVCRTHSRKYIWHLAKREEASGHILKSYHNIYYILRLMEDARKAIREGAYESFAGAIIQAYGNSGDGSQASGVDPAWDEAYPQSRPGGKHRSPYRRGGSLRSERKAGSRQQAL